MADPLDQLPNQGHVALLADRTSQPQPGGDHHGECHPDNAPLALDTYFIRLDVPESPRLLDQMLLHGLPVGTASPHPSGNGALIEAKRRDDGLRRTAVGQQRDHQADRLRRGPQAIQGGALGGTARLVAHGTQEALLLARVDADGALTTLASGRAGQIRAKYRCGVHDCPPGFAGERARRSMSGPLFLSQSTYPTIQGRATLQVEQSTPPVKTFSPNTAY